MHLTQEAMLTYTPEKANSAYTQFLVELDDATYIEPITPEVVAKIIEKERPDALLPTMGGQTGLNTSLALADMGVLEKFGVEMIGAKREAIEMAEDRKLFREAMDRLGIEEPGTLLGILVEEKVGQLKKIVDAITEENISFGSILVQRHWDKNMRAVFVYLLTNSVVRVKRKLTDLGFELLDPMDWSMERRPLHD